MRKKKKLALCLGFFATPSDFRADAMEEGSGSGGEGSKDAGEQPEEPAPGSARTKQPLTLSLPSGKESAEPTSPSKRGKQLSSRRKGAPSSSKRGKAKQEEKTYVPLSQRSESGGAIGASAQVADASLRLAAVAEEEGGKGDKEGAPVGGEGAAVEAGDISVDVPAVSDTPAPGEEGVAGPLFERLEEDDAAAAAAVAAAAETEVEAAEAAEAAADKKAAEDEAEDEAKGRAEVEAGTKAARRAKDTVTAAGEASAPASAPLEAVAVGRAEAGVDGTGAERTETMAAFDELASSVQDLVSVTTFVAFTQGRREIEMCDLHAASAMINDRKTIDPIWHEATGEARQKASQKAFEALPRAVRCHTLAPLAYLAHPAHLTLARLASLARLAPLAPLAPLSPPAGTRERDSSHADGPP
jgi:hypothetical protein